MSLSNDDRGVDYITRATKLHGVGPQSSLSIDVRSWVVFWCDRCRVCGTPSATAEAMTKCVFEHAERWKKRSSPALLDPSSCGWQELRCTVCMAITSSKDGCAPPFDFHGNYSKGWKIYFFQDVACHVGTACDGEKMGHIMTPPRLYTSGGT